jgi:NADPH2:quinone reductase
VPREAVLAVPPGVDLQQAASAGVAGLTAWGTVVDLAQVGAADRVLVLGAGGGVGLAVVSLAAALGAEVWGQLRRPEGEASVLTVGAAGVVVADADGLADAAGDLAPTVVVDALGGPYVSPALGLLGPYGRYVVFGTAAGAQVQLDWQAVYRRHLEVLGYGGLVLEQDERREKLQQVLLALADGRLRIPVGRTVALADGTQVFDRGGIPGKTVLDLQVRTA